MGKLLLGVVKWTALILGVGLVLLGAFFGTVVAFLLPFAIPIAPAIWIGLTTSNWWLGVVWFVVVGIVEVAIGLAAILELSLKFAMITRKMTVRAIAEMKEELLK